MDKNKAIELVQKLRRLSKSSNLYESARATERANAMMTKHGITDADLDGKPSAPFGYFAWVKTMRGKPTPEKFHQWRYSGVMPETKKSFESMTVGAPIPLDENEFKLSLDELSIRYPAPAIIIDAKPKP